jgi:glutathione peroxidase
MRSALLALVTAAVFAAPLAAAEKAAKDDSPVTDQKMKSLAGKDVDFSQYDGKVLLIVNVASECGATPQYEPLQGLYEKYKDQGLVVLGFPCNQFGAQEPGTALEIQEFCESNYNVTFPMFAKIDVNGEKAAPLYKHLTSREASAQDPGPVKWNFEKFLVGRDGKVIARYRTPVQPDSPKVVEAIEKELAKK